MLVRRSLVAATAAALTLGVSGCGSGTDLPAGLRSADGHATSHAAAPRTSSPAAEQAPDVPLRAGERFQSIRLRAPYTPKAPEGTGTDDYRCFLVDPGFETDQLVSGVQIAPGNAAIVHHVIVSKVEPEDVDEAKVLDAGAPGEGWTCFGGAGLAGTRGGDLDKADWVGAWAPGGGERVMAEDIGIPLAKGSRIVIQMHYNLLAGGGADQSSARLRLSPASAGTCPAAVHAPSCGLHTSVAGVSWPAAAICCSCGTGYGPWA